MASVAPTLHGTTGSAGSARPVVVLLHGGKVASHDPVRPWHLSYLRMVPIARMLRRAVGRDADVVLLRYRYRGWNGAERSPVADAQWAIETLLRAREPGARVVLVGHSMGGRTAAAVAGHPAVAGVVALAPWWPSGTETDTMAPGSRLLVVHGTRDRWTDATLSDAATSRAARRGVVARFVSMAGAGHFMLHRSWRWSRLTRDAVRDVLFAPDSAARDGIRPADRPI
ncbi:alpha/beta hydrolase [Rhodococcoides corynebacterioides]|uniref:Alpha/beta fold hydrolase n=1 Tax=Rhodococcoides corynebacterioides TaxID=53972 RepID=A0ABS7P1P9_9NOCA|nr:alpha/beta fold hydrolase [Rhodococcus corynebacterioides]MBY6365981.1 alpha/beta fold hydrolase [Rhodococcus corynebacterioides]MBY6409089.1 alpha/beta fold hydrolase [Rhodococcus corynebacterioides]